MNPIIYLLTFAYLALGQRIAIGAPAEWATVKPGSNITVEVDRPVCPPLITLLIRIIPPDHFPQMTLTGSDEVAIAIGLWPCAGYGDEANRTCAEMDVTQVLGNVLYTGTYAPQLPPPPEYEKPPYQNFTVTVPANFATGQASLGVAHFSLIGVSRAFQSLGMRRDAD